MGLFQRLSGLFRGPVNPPDFKAQFARALEHHRQIRAKYDAAQTVIGNELHWQNADHLDPHAAASFRVRRTLRSRSRYEVIENNPFLKGTILTIANDFVGSGPKLVITDPRLSPEARKQIETRFQEWATKRRLRQKLWRMRIAKIVDGETFLRVYPNTKVPYPLSLDYQVIECDQVTTEGLFGSGGIPSNVLGQEEGNRIDGIEFDYYQNPTRYFILRIHPGAGIFFPLQGQQYGSWVDAGLVIHWFRQDRGWLRGIPETTPSLPLCAILRRYTMAVLRHQETAANFTAIIETEGPPMGTAWTDSEGNVLQDDPFDTFPIEQGLITNLPYGYKLKQLAAVPAGADYDDYVGSLLREITRPLLSTYNIASGSSKDSNMASAVVDTNIYKGGQEAERIDCNDAVLVPMYGQWWREAILVPDYLPPITSEALRHEPPSHRWRWDSIGLEHTDPQKVAAAVKAMHEGRFITDRDIQERYFDRSLDQWREEIKEDDTFRDGLESLTDPSTGEDVDVQQTALNGAQIASLADIIDRVAQGQMPIETARGMLDAAFPTLTPEEIEAILAPLQNFTPKPQEQPKPKTAPPAA